MQDRKWFCNTLTRYDYGFREWRIMMEVTVSHAISLMMVSILFLEIG